MNRSTALVVLRTAGYHDDRKTWTRTYIENRVSMRVANAEWQRGQGMKAAGVPCTCRDCALAPVTVNGSDLRPGDVIEVWWQGGRDTIMSLQPYRGPLAHLFPQGAQLAAFAICKSGMTIDNAATYKVIARGGRG